jgi:signal transduction histidine kinase/ActR/RegA family two-component response regulator
MLHRVLILAPIGRDGPASSELLQRAGITTLVCAGYAQLLEELEKGAAAVFVAEEGLFGQDLPRLSDWVKSQPPWSDLPFVLLTSRRDRPRVMAWRQTMVDILRNVSMLERPVQPITLTSMIRATLRARNRQYEIKALIEAREKAAIELQQQVADATRGLREQMIERSRVEDSLRQAQKMEAIGQLTGGIAHDFNNLLTAVTSSLDLLKKRISHDERALALLDNAVNGAERGARLTQRMLAFARRQELSIAPVHLATLVSGMEGLIERAVGPSVSLHSDIPTDLPCVGADANQLEAALLNLAVNARDAMPNGGDVLIRARMASDDERGKARLASGKYVLLSVTDFGTGMDATTVLHAVEPFFTTKGVGKGTGLGLSMVQGLAEQSGGKLRISSEINRGTVIEILLPVTSAAQDEPSADVCEPAAIDEKERGTILIVDDDELVLQSTVALLDDMGFSVLEAHSGMDALEALEHSTAVDFVLTDHAMPGMTGLQLAGRIAQLWPELPVILATGYAQLDGDVPANVRRLAKPFRRADLESAIAQTLTIDLQRLRAAVG